MVSISMSAPNTVIRAALRTLDSDIRTTQNRIATGLKVSSYSDNAVVWNAASNIRKDIALGDNLKSDLAIAKGRADVSSTALKTILDRLGDLKDKNVTAGATTDTDAKAAIAAEMSGLVAQINAAVSSAKFQGVSWLASAGAKTINIAVDDGAAVTTSFTTEDIAGAGALNTLVGTAITSTNAGTTGSGTLGAAIDAAVTQITTYAGKMSGLAKGLANQLDFLSTLNTVRASALSNLVDADLEEESARAKALEVRQQLAYQALSIGNNAQQNILLLFR